MAVHHGGRGPGHMVRVWVSAIIGHIASILMETGSYILMEDGLSTLGLE